MIMMTCKGQLPEDKKGCIKMMEKRVFIRGIAVFCIGMLNG